MSLDHMSMTVSVPERLQEIIPAKPTGQILTEDLRVTGSMTLGRLHSLASASGYYVKKSGARTAALRHGSVPLTEVDGRWRAGDHELSDALSARIEFCMNRMTAAFIDGRGLDR